MFRLLAPLALLSLLPLAAAAEDAQRCAHAQPRELKLDLAGVRTVLFEITNNDVDVHASAGADGRISGRACASNEKDLARLTLTQRREGDKLVVRAQQEDGGRGLSIGNRYAYMTLRANVPADVLVQLNVGSGDGSVDGASEASADVGSGDVKATRVRGRFTASVGSGDVDVDDVGALHVVSVGSGDLKARHVRGATEIGSVGSGDLQVNGTQGPLKLASIGSGDADLRDIGGDVDVGSIGSGNLQVDGVRGDLSVRSISSGDVESAGVTGTVTVPHDH
jgi:hypothetical protein